jgi:predicted nucleic acid-binding protein
MVDINIILDVFLERQPFYESSRKVLSLCEEKRIAGFVTASTITDIYYLIRRHFRSTELAYKYLGDVLDIVKVLPVTNDDVLSAYLEKAKDFEDCLLMTCAKKNKCTHILTRNKTDFANYKIPLLSPEELLRNEK